MNEVVVDSSSWIDYFKGQGHPEIEDLLGMARVRLPALVVAELLSARMTHTERTALVDFLERLPMFGTSFEHWARVGELRAKLLRKGISVSTPDAHVAQCALDVQASLMTRDRIFGRIAELVPLKLV